MQTKKEQGTYPWNDKINVKTWHWDCWHHGDYRTDRGRNSPPSEWSCNNIVINTRLPLPKRAVSPCCLKRFTIYISHRFQWIFKANIAKIASIRGLRICNNQIVPQFRNHYRRMLFPGFSIPSPVFSCHANHSSLKMSILFNVGIAPYLPIRYFFP